MTTPGWCRTRSLIWATGRPRWPESGRARIRFCHLWLRLAGRRCIVVGGGAVAERKVVPLLAADTRVTVVAPALTSRLRRLAAQGRIEALLRPYCERDLGGAFLAFAASGQREVNRAVWGEAREAGILANVADDPSACDFAVPSTLQQGRASLAISTGGRSPALAHWLRLRLTSSLRSWTEPGGQPILRGRGQALLYPISLKLKGRRCLVVGSDDVALRKAALLADSGAAVAVVAGEPCNGLRELADQGRVRLLSRFRPEEMEGVFLAIAASGDKELDHAVAREARARGVLVNVRDDPESSDFFAPALVRRGDIVISVSTGGRSPALARKVREYIESLLPQEYEELLDLVAEIRTELRQAGVSFPYEAWERLLTPELIALLREGRREEARARLLAAAPAPGGG